MAYRFLASAASVAALALVNTAMPEPIMFASLSAGLACIGLGMVYEAGSRF